MAELTIGCEATLEIAVDESRTAAAVGSGSLPVYATPMLIAAMEEAACRAIAGGLGEDETSVGTRVEVDHLAPTPVGGTVQVTARLTGIEGRSLTFAVEARDAASEVARGVHKRFLVQAARFMDKAAKRLG